MQWQIIMFLLSLAFLISVQRNVGKTTSPLIMMFKEVAVSRRESDQNRAVKVTGLKIEQQLDRQMYKRILKKRKLKS